MYLNHLCANHVTRVLDWHRRDSVRPRVPPAVRVGTTLTGAFFFLADDIESATRCASLGCAGPRAQGSLGKSPSAVAGVLAQWLEVIVSRVYRSVDSTYHHFPARYTGHRAGSSLPCPVPTDKPKCCAIPEDLRVISRPVIYRPPRPKTHTPTHSIWKP